MFVSLTRSTSTRLYTCCPLCSGTEAETLITKPPLPGITWITLGLTSTTPKECSKPDTRSVRRVQASPSGQERKVILVSFLLLLRITPTFSILIPSPSVSSLAHTTLGMTAFWHSLTSITPVVPSIASKNCPGTFSYSIKGGVLTPTTKLQTPFCAALKRYSSKYSHPASFLTPKIYQGSSERDVSLHLTVMVMIFEVGWDERRVMESLRQ